MNRRSPATHLAACAVLALAAASCAVFSPRATRLPCDDSHLSFYPAVPADSSLELTGRVRVEIAQYRFRGLARILFSPRFGMRVDFEHSSLFGAIHRRLTLFCGDSLVIVDPDEGTSPGADSSLAILRQALRVPAEPDDVLYALLLRAPKCAEVQGGTLETTRGGMRITGVWRGREITLSAERGKGPRELLEQFSSLREGFVVRYDSYRKGDRPAYPRRITLRRQSGSDQVALELLDIKIVDANPSLFVPEWYSEASPQGRPLAQRLYFPGTSASPGCIR